MDVTVQFGKIHRWGLYEPSDIQYIYYDDGTEYWRKGVRGGAYVIDHALTLGGFEGDENINWENVWSIE